MSKLTLYDFEDIQKLIEDAAEQNDGEVSDSDMALLIQAQTGTLQKLENLVGYMKHLEAFSDMAKEEAKKVKAKADAALKRLDSIKGYIKPYLQEHGGKVNVGVHTLSLRKSSAVIVEDGFDNVMYCNETVVRTPDKKSIKESLMLGIEVKGATLENRESVVLK